MSTGQPLLPITKLDASSNSTTTVSTQENVIPLLPVEALLKQEHQALVESNIVMPTISIESLIEQEVSKLKHKVECDETLIFEGRTKHRFQVERESRNCIHPFQGLKQKIEQAFSKEKLQQRLDTKQPKPVPHGYNMQHWLFTARYCTDDNHLFAKSNTTLRKNNIKKRYRQHNQKKRHAKEEFYTNRACWYLQTLANMPYLQFNVDRQDLRSQTKHDFEKHASQFGGLEAENYLASILPILPSDISYFAVDKNNHLLFIYIHNGVPKEEQEGMWLAALELLITFPNQYPKSTDKRHDGFDSSIDNDDDDTYVYHLMDWCPIGRPHEPCISRQSLAMGKVTAVDSVIRLTKSMNHLRINLASLLEVVDEDQHKKYLHATTTQATEAYHALLQACNQDVFLGCVLNTGRCRNHRDWSDAAGALSAMTPLGHFVGGHIVLPQLGVRIPYSPGNLFMCSTQMLEHFITEWVGRRVGTVHCSHQDRIETTDRNPRKCTTKPRVSKRSTRQVKNDDEDYIPPKSVKKLFL
jgi:hypothetical protein